MHAAIAGAKDRDFQVWIPKVNSARPTGANLRPLQLPTTIRRVFGALTASALAAATEPHITAGQAATANT
eukprot:651344-Prorocentrum_lima.AAC.1